MHDLVSLSRSVIDPSTPIDVVDLLANRAEEFEAALAAIADPEFVAVLVAAAGVRLP